MPHAPDQVADELLVLHAQAGDRRALAVLARRWERRLLLHAMRLTNHPDGAREVAQDTWLAITRGINRLNDPAAFRAWAYSILRRKAADWIRTRRIDRRRAALPPDHRAPAAALPDPADPADPADRPIRRALATLGPEDRELITLRHVEDLSVAELATVFAVPAGTVKSRLHTARARLLAALTATEKGTDHDTHR